MSSPDPYDDDRDRGYDDTRGEPGGGGEPDRLRARARRRTGFPGLLLQLYGAFFVVVSVAIGALGVLNPEAAIDRYYDWVEKMQQQQPPNQRQQLPPRADAVRALQVEGPIYGVVGLTSGIFMFVGGAKMRSVRGYGLAMAGSVLSVFPGLCCCCLGLVPGIWAFVVLLSPDVKRAFALAPAAGTYE